MNRSGKTKKARKPALAAVVDASMIVMTVAALIITAAIARVVEIDINNVK